MYVKLGKQATDPKKLRTAIDKFFPANKVKLTENEQKRLDYNLSKLDKTKREKWYELQNDLKQIAVLQYHPPSARDKDRYYKARVMDEKTKKEIDSDVEKIDPEWLEPNFDPVFLELVKANPGKWIPVTLGASRDDVAPRELQTAVNVEYRQNEENYCLCYSIASALHYIGLVEEGKKVAALAEDSIDLENKKQLEYIVLHMQDIVPNIRMYQAFGKALKKGKGKKKQDLTVEQLVQAKTPFPTIVIPWGKDLSVNHAVAVVDDLIFDSTQRNALTLTHKSFHWICGALGSCDMVYGAIRFQRPMKQGLPALSRKMKTNKGIGRDQNL